MDEFLSVLPTTDADIIHCSIPIKNNISIYATTNLDVNLNLTNMPSPVAPAAAQTQATQGWNQYAVNEAAGHIVPTPTQELAIDAWNRYADTQIVPTSAQTRAIRRWQEFSDSI